MNRSEPDDVRLAHALLERHYKQPVRPVGEVCTAITTWLKAISDNHDGEACEDGCRDESLHRLAKAWGEVGWLATLQASKSNLLSRLIFLREPLRTRKCPEHGGHWTGCPAPGDECPHGCTVGGNTTGWLP